MDAINLSTGDEARKQREHIRGLYEAGPEGMLRDLTAARALLEKEIDCLKEQRVMELSALAEPKSRLIANIQVYNGIMRERPQWLERISADTRDEIRRLYENMEELMQETLAYLAKAKRVQQVLLNGIKKGVEKSSRRGGVYGATGGSHAKGSAFATPYGNAATSFSVNKDC